MVVMLKSVPVLCRKDREDKHQGYWMHFSCRVEDELGWRLIYLNPSLASLSVLISRSPGRDRLPFICTVRLGIDLSFCVTR
jgi:hypothetical protein